MRHSRAAARKRKKQGNILPFSMNGAPYISEAVLFCFFEPWSLILTRDSDLTFTAPVPGRVFHFHFLNIRVAENVILAIFKRDCLRRTVLRTDAALNRESHVDYDDEDYERMKKDGFE